MVFWGLGDINAKDPAACCAALSCRCSTPGWHSIGAHTKYQTDNFIVVHYEAGRARHISLQRLLVLQIQDGGRYTSTFNNFQPPR